MCLFDVDAGNQMVKCVYVFISDVYTGNQSAAYSD